MNDRIELAEKLFKQGYNCSQSVFAAFSELYGIDTDTALKLSSSFGGGLGRMREVCGAVSGMCMVAGLETGSARMQDPEGKKFNYEVVQRLSREFKAISGSIICRELLGLNHQEPVEAAPQKRTEEYYRKRPCVQLVKDAAQIIGEILYALTFVPVTSEEQLEKVEELAGEIWHEHYDSIIGEDQVNYMLKQFQSAEAMKKQMAENGYEYFLLSTMGGDAGYFAFQKEEGTLFLSKIYLLKKYRGRNYARRVMDFLEERCREDRLGRVWLTVNRNNHNSIAVYEKLGFIKAGTQVADIGEGYVMDDFRMEKYVEIR